MLHKVFLFFELLGLSHYAGAYGHGFNLYVKRFNVQLNLSRVISGRRGILRIDKLKLALGKLNKRTGTQFNSVGRRCCNWQTTAECTLKVKFTLTAPK